jgi:hypothetical protein
MKYKKSLRAIGLAVITILGINNHASSQSWNPGHSIGTVNGVYHYTYSQTPAQLVEVQPAGIPNTGLTYQWESSTSAGTGFTNISGATASNYTISGPLAQTTYYRRKTTRAFETIYSNVVKIQVVSVNWEDLNYIREHVVTTTSVTTWTAVDQLAIGPKEQNTTYIDGMGRSIEKVSRETATPPGGGGLWGDLVQFYQYDAMGRAPISYLPYSTTSQSGKYKTSPLVEQPQYYSTVYNETMAYQAVTFDNSPLVRIINAKQSGTVWGGATGVGLQYDLNSAADDVRIFSLSYVQGSAPVCTGVYAPNTLYKITTVDESGKKFVEYTNMAGQLVLKKIQLADNPSASHDGWICTYTVYDDFDMVRYEIQPEAVKYLASNGWSFAGPDGPAVLNEYCFQYNFDDKGRLIWKKAPGAAASNAIYDQRDRTVFVQDGNQAAMTIPQWTTTLYDDLDRQVVNALYNTTKTIANLKTDLNNASANSTISVGNPANTGGGPTINLAVTYNPVLVSDLNNPSAANIIKYLFYDNYSFNGVKTFNTNYTNLSAYSTSDPNVVPLATSNRTTSFPTGSKVRVLGSNTFLAATHYYDEKGQHIQGLEDNIK